MRQQAQLAYVAAASAVVAAFEKAGPFPGQEVTPPLLTEAIDQCRVILGDPDGAQGLDEEELEELGTHALNCVSDLALWASHLKLPAQRAAIEDLGLEFAEWLAERGITINVIEPVVNALARRANAVNDPESLLPLAALAGKLIARTGRAARADASGSNAWRVLNFNYAIIATRTQRPELMEQAYDLLEANLPDECPEFFAEGARESAKAAYRPHVGEALRRRLAKWTVRH